jgi:predicted DNA-binding protein YlxM (UPF0122 family)
LERQAIFFNQTKTMRRLLTDSEMRDMICYYAKCQSLRDFIDEKVVAKNFHFQKIKQLTNQLIVELEKQVDVLMNAEGGDSKGLVLDQFVNASIQADHLFDIALKLELLDNETKIECATKVSDIFKQYGVE